MKRQPPREPDVRQPTGERLRQALSFVRQQLSALESLPREPPFNDEYVVWARVTSASLKDYFGQDSDEFRWVHPQLRPAVAWSGAQHEALQREGYQEILQGKRVGLESVLARYEVLPPTSGDAVATTKRRARAFVSHGGKKPSLVHIQDFLRALGVEPIVVEKRASEGREVHDNVDTYRKQSDFAVVLWTRDIQDNEGGWLPSGSVQIEVGELRSQFASRVIYLREDGVKLPAMASTLVYQPFTEHNIGPAFMKIVTELHGWGWLTISPPEGPND